MISKKLLKKLPPNKKYLIYDSLYTYVLKKFDSGSFHINVLGYAETIYVYEKDLEHLEIEARNHNNEKLEWHLKNEYVYNGYTNQYKVLSGIGLLSTHADFYDWWKLKFFGEYKDEETVKELNRFKKVFRAK